jgi:hypothetical protein
MIHCGSVCLLEKTTIIFLKGRWGGRIASSVQITSGKRIYHRNVETVTIQRKNEQYYSC